MSETIELVTFRLKPGADREAFVAAAAASSDWARRQPGFVWRALSEEDGLWTDIVVWTGRAEALAAAEGFGAAPEVAPFAAMIDMATATMNHAATVMTTRGG